MMPDVRDLIEAPDDPNAAVKFAARKAMGVDTGPRPGTMQAALHRNLGSVEGAARKISDQMQLEEAQALERYNARMRAAKASEGAYTAEGVTPPSDLTQRAGQALDSEKDAILLQRDEADREGVPGHGQWLGEPREETLMEHADPEKFGLQNETIPWRTEEAIQKEQAAGHYGPPAERQMNVEELKRRLRAALGQT